MADAISVAGELPEHLTRDVELETEPPPVVEILRDEMDHRSRFAHGCSSGQGNATVARVGRSTLV
jgi:hypothetical protein